jgi:hypothetical protein
MKMDAILLRLTKPTKLESETVLVRAGFPKDKRCMNAIITKGNGTVS